MADIWNGNGNWTGDPSDWSSKAAPGSGAVAEIQSGTDTLTTTTAVSSVTIAPAANLALTGAASLSASSLLNLANLYVDAGASDGGGKLTLTGLLDNLGPLTIGNSSLDAATMVTAGELINNGTVTLLGNDNLGATEQATLDVASAAPAALAGATIVRGDADLEFKSGAVTSIGAGDFVELDGAQARISIDAGTVSSALTTLASNYGTLLMRGGTSYGAGGATIATTVGFTNAGTVDLDTYNADGGSNLKIGGALDNLATLNIGNGGLSAATTVTVAGDYSGAGVLTLEGGIAGAGASQATLNVGAAAAAALIGSTILRGDADLEFKSGAITSIGAKAWLEIDGAQARISDGAATTSSALTALTSNYGTLLMRGGTSYGEGGATISTTVGFTNAGTVDLDTYNADGGSSLKIGGALDNLSTLNIGNGALGAATTVTVVGGYSNSGALNLIGGDSSAGANQATLNIGGAAPGTLTASTLVGGDANLEFKSGAITAIGSGATLALDGAQSRISIGAAAANSALTGLAMNHGTLALLGNAGGYGAGGTTVSTTVGFTNTGTVDLDTYNANGGSSLKIGGALNNLASLTIGNGALSAATTVTVVGAFTNSGALDLLGGDASDGANQATLNIGGSAPATLTASTLLGGDADLEFKSGAITEIGAGATLELDGAQSRISIGAAATNSALTGLTVNDGTLALLGAAGGYGAGGATVSTTVGFTNAGTVDLDTYNANGGSSLEIGGGLDNLGALNIGNGALSAATTVTVAGGLTDSGALNLLGGNASAGANQATLSVGGAAAATLTASILLGGDADLEFKSGAITAIGSGTTLEMDGAQSRISIGSAATNSALKGLNTNDGTLALFGNAGGYGVGGTTISTTVGFTNNGTVDLDTYNANGGSGLKIGGALDNLGALNIGNGALSAATTVTVVGAFSNTGALNLFGGNASGAANQATFEVGGAAAATLIASTFLSGDANLAFKSGAITSVGSGATLELDGAQSRISIGAGTTNSALTSLGSNYGTLALFGNAGGYGAGGTTIATTVGFTNAGAVELDLYNGDGGSGLNVGGGLDNLGAMTIGNGGSSAATRVSAASLVNTGAISMAGGSALTELLINGAASNSGSIQIDAGSELDVTGGKAFAQTGGTTTVGGLLAAATIQAEGGLIDFTSAISKGDGVGALDIYAAGEIGFGAAVDASHTVTFEATTGVLAIAAPSAFAATIANFGGDDVIDLQGAVVTSFAYSGGTTSGVLTLTGASGTLATLAFAGDYKTSSFAMVSDASGGTDILDPPSAKARVGRSPSPTSLKPGAFVEAAAAFASWPSGLAAAPMWEEPATHSLLASPHSMA